MSKLGLIDKAFILKRCALFQEVELDLILPLADKASIGTFNKGELIFAHNQEGSRLYIIAQGSVSLFDESKLLAECLAYDYFGDEALFNDRPRGYNAESTDRSIIVSIAKTHLMSFLIECPTVAISLIQSWAQRQDFRKRN